MLISLAASCFWDMAEKNLMFPAAGAIEASNETLHEKIAEFIECCCDRKPLVADILHNE